MWRLFKVKIYYIKKTKHLHQDLLYIPEFGGLVGGGIVVGTVVVSVKHREHSGTLKDNIVNMVGHWKIT